MSALPLRKDIPAELCWDVSLLYKDNESFVNACRELLDQAKRFQAEFAGKIRSCRDNDEFIKILEQAESILIPFDKAANYASLPQDADRNDRAAVEVALKFETMAAEFSSTLSFFSSELKEQDPAFLRAVASEHPEYSAFLENLCDDIPHRLSSESEALLAALSPVLNFPAVAYNVSKLADMRFEPFKAGARELQNSFVLYENNYAADNDSEIRRAAFHSFSEGLERFVNTIGADYYTQVRGEKILADLRGHKSVIDYLLHGQRVSRELYDRQIDLIMRDLAPHMRRHAKLLQRAHGLDEMHYADLKISLDPSYDPQVEVGEAKSMVRDALSVLGPDYMKAVDKTLNERRIDFAQNQGKATGGYCASPYHNGSYILLNWNGKLDEVFTLAHELGHAGHFALAGENQKYLQYDCSWYLVEAPSTCNELIFANYLMRRNTEDKRFRRWVLASLIANTYYHNFITHLLEAAYQREVYRRIDAGEALQGHDFSELYLAQLKAFWGDSIVYDPGCELTWMRQPHYYNGLYSYTYSAGLTISTVVAKRINDEGQPAIDDWLRTLRSGGALRPLEFARSARAEIGTDEALSQTIAYIGSLVDEIESLTTEIGDF